MAEAAARAVDEQVGLRDPVEPRRQTVSSTIAPLILSPAALLTDQLRQELQHALGSAYSLERELVGGMSRVFVAEETALGRKVVVKVLPPEMAASVNLGRFKREIALAARLQHPHIVPLLTAGEMNGVPYFTMPYVEGESLRARLSRHGELPIAEAMRLLREVSSALAYAHDHGVVHRDIKPDNILLSGGSAMVTDFGVAKAISASSNGDEGGVTSLGVALGTPSYMSPEQASADPTVDHRADIYALGVVAYEALTGQPPFVGRTPQGLLAAHVTENPDPVARRRQNIPAPLAALVMSCLEKRAADRPQSAHDVVHALDAITTPSGGTHPTSATPIPARRRRTPLLATLGVAAAALLALLGWRAVAARRATTANDTPRSIAVLPFDNASGDTASAYFADGLADELTTELGSVPGLSVASYRAARTFKDKQVPLRDVAKALNVTYVLEGTVRREGTTMRLNTRLTDATTGFAMWSRSYDRDVKDALAVQSEVATAIASALRLRMSEGTGGSPQKAPTTVNPAAFDLYLQSAVTSHRGPHWWPEGMALAKRAVGIDPNFAPGWARLARMEAWAPLYGIPGDTFPILARRHAERALALDSTLAAAYEALGAAHWVQYQFDDALAAEQRALSIDPNDIDALITAALMLSFQGRVDSAGAVLEHAVQLDPLRRALWTNLSYVYTADGRPAAGIRAGQRSAAFGANPFAMMNIALAYLVAGKADSARVYSDRVSGEDAHLPSAAGIRIMTLVAAGNDVEATRETDSLVKQMRAGRPVAFDAAIGLAWTQRGDSAMSIIEDLAQHKDPLLMQTSPTCGPELAPLRELARMRKLAETFHARICTTPLPSYVPVARDGRR